MKIRVSALFISGLLLVLLGIGCSNKNESIANQKQIEDQLQMAGLSNVTIHLDENKKTAALNGSVNSDQEKATAERIVKATAPRYQMTDNIVVEQQNATNPAGAEENGSQKPKSPESKATKQGKKSRAQTASE